MTEKKPSGRQPFKGPGPDNPDAKLLREIGEALYGSTWQADLSAALKSQVAAWDFDPATMRGWSTGRRAVSPWIWPALWHIAGHRQAMVDAAAQRVRDHLEKTPIAWAQYQRREQRALNPYNEGDE